MPKKKTTKTPKKLPKKIPPKTPQLSDRENYLRNRNNMLGDFRASLQEVQKPEPSVPGEIAGMNFQQFSDWNVFNSIVQQEEYIEYTEKYKPEYVELAEEKEILTTMIKEAKAVYGEEYQTGYDRVKDQN